MVNDVLVMESLPTDGAGQPRVFDWIDRLTRPEFTDDQKVARRELLGEIAEVVTEPELVLLAKSVPPRHITFIFYIVSNEWQARYAKWLGITRR